MNEFKFRLNFNKIKFKNENIINRNKYPFQLYWIIKFNLIQDDLKFEIFGRNKIIPLYSKIISNHILNYYSNKNWIILKFKNIYDKNITTTISNITNKKLNEIRILNICTSVNEKDHLNLILKDEF